MGFEDDFGDDDDVPAKPVAEATDLTRVANGVHGRARTPFHREFFCDDDKVGCAKKRAVKNEIGTYVKRAPLLQGSRTC
jgi:hypothetical protein